MAIPRLSIPKKIPRKSYPLCRHYDERMDDLDSLTRQVLARQAAMALYARQWLDAAAAEDAVQEALTALLMQTRKPDDPVAWMFRAVRNAAIDSARALSRRRRRENLVATSKGEWFESDPDSAIDVESAQQALRQLSLESRQIVVLRIWGELNFTQIAPILGLSVSTVHGRYGAALTEMRKALEKSWNRTD
jgi:RNA polymerase sigma factor (sigma-70 family)